MTPLTPEAIAQIHDRLLDLLPLNWPLTEREHNHNEELDDEPDCPACLTNAIGSAASTLSALAQENARLLRDFEIAMVEKNLEISALTSKVSALAAEGDEWQQAGEAAVDRCRETHGKHFILVGGHMGGPGVPAVAYHEEPICEPELARLRSSLAAAHRAIEGLTPGGSEFVGDPERCVRHVQEMRAAEHAALIESRRRLAAAEKVVEAARTLDKLLETGELGLKGTARGWAQPVVETFRAALSSVSTAPEPTDFSFGYLAEDEVPTAPYPVGPWETGPAPTAPPTVCSNCGQPWDSRRFTKVDLDAPAPEPKREPKDE